MVVSSCISLKCLPMVPMHQAVPFGKPAPNPLSFIPSGVGRYGRERGFIGDAELSALLSHFTLGLSVICDD